MAQEKLVEGWTDPITQQLLNDGTAVDITGCTVAIELYDSSNRAITITGSVSVVDATTGKVKFSPSATDLKAANSPLKVRWMVTDALSKVSFFPNDPADTWIVRRP